MSKPEDKTFNTLRTISDKRATKNNGSIVSNGGGYFGRNIRCEEEIIANELIIEDVAKIGGDISIGGICYCPDIYTVNEDVIKFKRNVVPGCVKNPSKPNEKSNLGTVGDPWEIAHINKLISNEICINEFNTNQLNANQINSSNINTSNLCVTEATIEHIPTLSVGTNECGQPSFYAGCDQVNISTDFNIVNPNSNEIMMLAADGVVEVFVPLFKQWDSFKPIIINYVRQQILVICASYIFINTGSETDLFIDCNADTVPCNTIVKIYFVGANQLSKAKYELVINKHGKKYIFKSVHPVKKIKLIFMENHIYLA